MKRETMTPRERWTAVLEHRTPDRVPMDYWATDEATARLLKHLGRATREELLERLHVDAPLRLAGRYVGPPVEAGANVFGCRFQRADYGSGAYRECVFHPLAKFATVEEIEAEFQWPKADWWDYSHLPKIVAGQEHRPIQGGGSEPFLLYGELRGLETAYMDLVLHPEIVHYCLDKLFDLAFEGTRRLFEAVPGQVLFSYVAEDLGSQDGLLISPSHVRTFLLPRMKRMMDLAHEAGAFVFHHSDGAVRPMIPELIEAGIDLLNPIQWRCPGMEREGLKSDFGEKIAFHGGMDNQRTLPFGTVADVRDEVRDNLRILGAGGGYILAPCHNLQSVGPVENVLALYETGYAEGWYS